MAKIVAGFHARDEEWIIARKLHALSQFCDRIVVLLDKCTDRTEEVCKRFANVRVEHYRRQNTSMRNNGSDGPICEEGLMRQLTWDLCAEHEPDWIILGDADEIPSPAIQGFLRTDAGLEVDVYYLKMINLYKHPQTYIGGQSAWSPEFPRANRKGVICRWRPGVEYRYDLYKTRHCRLEPNTVDPFRAVEDDRHVLLGGILKDPVLVHWKWIHWQRWRRSTCYQDVKYQDYFRGMELEATRREWLWQKGPTDDDSLVVLHAWEPLREARKAAN